MFNRFDQCLLPQLFTEESSIIDLVLFGLFDLPKHQLFTEEYSVIEPVLVSLFASSLQYFDSEDSKTITFSYQCQSKPEDSQLCMPIITQT